MNKKRPINLDLTTLHFPVMAITSIMHRLSGIVVFVLLPLMLYYLQQSLGSAESFHHLQEQLLHPLHRFLLWGFLGALSYHFMAGVRHLVADYGCGETVLTARRTAWLLLLMTLVVLILLGAWIW